MSVCPRCGADVEVETFTQYHPYGSTVAGEDLTDIRQDCDCDLTDEEVEHIVEQAADESEPEFEWPDL